MSTISNQHHNDMFVYVCARARLNLKLMEISQKFDELLATNRNVQFKFAKNQEQRTKKKHCWTVMMCDKTENITDSVAVTMKTTAFAQQNQFSMA